MRCLSYPVSLHVSNGTCSLEQCVCVCVCVCDCGHADTYPEFVKLVERMWAEDPDDRPPFDIILAEVTDIFDPDKNGNALAGTTSTTKSTNDDAQSTDEETESTPEGESEGEDRPDN